MKIYRVFLSVVTCGILGACMNTVASKEGTQYLTRLDSEPTGCVYLYKVDTQYSVYNIDDAYRYLENTIVDQGRDANAYFVTKQDINKNEWKPFAPENTFVLKAKVYSCPRAE